MLMRTAGNQCWMRSEPSGKSWDASNTDEGRFCDEDRGEVDETAGHFCAWCGGELGGRSTVLSARCRCDNIGILYRV
jgi:hypothetical protein